MDNKIKKRNFPENNYSAIYFNGKTMRLVDDPKKPITELDYPEFYDISITSKCNGKCPFCYQDSINNGDHATSLVEKIKSYFGNMTENQKPFQVAIGGGEPTLHPQFVESLKALKELDISPNYTTNGEFINDKNMLDKILKGTKEYSEGVAFSCHPHLKKQWKKGAKLFIDNDIFTNFHHIISDKDSVDNFIEIYHEWKDGIKYFILLPMMPQGRSVQGMDLKTWIYLRDELKKIDDISNVGFGANFYPYLKDDKNHNINVDLYEPEILSKYINLVNMKMYPSSFSKNILKEIK